jgi:peptide/nickel transport system substrate-binding protein/oligopeptide transport system substrate-binding protein
MRATGFRSAPPRPPGRRVALLILLLLAGGASAACAPSQRSSGKESVFRFRLREDPPTLDPALANDQLSEAVLFNVFRGLVWMDPATVEVRPSLAASYTVDPDGRTYTFRLRDGATFHNGRPITARDVEYSFKRLLDPKTRSPRRYILEPLEGARAFIDGTTDAVRGLVIPDDRTVVLRLERPYGPFLPQLTMINASVVPRETYEDPGRGYLRSPVGCGPFRFTRWEQSNFLELAAFDAFFGGRPAIDRVVVRFIENRQSAIQEYLAGGLDSLDEVPHEDPALIERLGAEVHKYPFMGTQFLGFNLARPPFKGNTALRKAFNYAVDKEYLARVMDTGDPARGIIPPGVPGHDPALPGYPQDLAKARRLLIDAGYPGGKGLPPITLWFNTSEDLRRVMQRVQADLEAIGVTIGLREMDWPTLISAIEGTSETPGEAQMFRFGWYLDYPDADAILRPLLHTRSFGPPGNFGRYSNARVDALLDEALGPAGPGERERLYREAERVAVMDDACWLFIGYYRSSTLFKPYVKGIVTTPLGEFRIPLEALRLDAAPV